jgi:transposase
MLVFRLRMRALADGPDCDELVLPNVVDLERAVLDPEALVEHLLELAPDAVAVVSVCTVPGISWVLAYTIAAGLGDINRFPTPRTLAGYSGLCPRVYQSGERDLRGRLSKQGPRYLRWALVEAATHACTHPAYRDRYQQTKARIRKQPGARVAQVDLARTLSAAIWHMLSRGERFAPKGATDPLAALTAPEMRHRSELQSALSSHQEAIER